MKFGVVLPTVGDRRPAELIACVACRAEELGFDSVWVSDHLAVPWTFTSRHPRLGDAMEWMRKAIWLDPLVALTVAASATSSLLLGTAVFVLPLRDPVVVAKMASSLDVVSRDRLVLGVGTGWLEQEFELFGVPFGERVPRLEEGIGLLRSCWGADPVVHHGEHYSYAPFALQPKPARGAAVPILIGGTHRRAVARAATLGDGWLPSNLLPDALARSIGEYRHMTEQLDRPPGEIVLRVGLSVTLDRELVAAYRRAGVNTLIAELDCAGAVGEEDVAADVAEVARVLGL